MTIIMVRVFHEVPKGEAENAVQNWVENHPVWSEDPVEHSMRETAILSSDGVEVPYVAGDFRFHQDAVDATALLDDLEARLQSIQTGLWYRLGVHEDCDYHEDNQQPCEWDPSLKREHGDIPSAIPPVS